MKNEHRSIVGDTCRWLATIFLLLPQSRSCSAREILVNGRSSELAIRNAGDHALRITLRPIAAVEELPFSPAIADRQEEEPFIRIRDVERQMTTRGGGFAITIAADPLTLTIADAEGRQVQRLTFESSGELTFDTGPQPILGMGEGGPPLRGDWRNASVEFDRRGRLHAMKPRWQANAYGSRNPVGLLVGTSGWALWVATPWGQFDLREAERGVFSPWGPRTRREDAQGEPDSTGSSSAANQGRPPTSDELAGYFDVFVFDAQKPEEFFADLSAITGPSVMPPKWSLGYMQSHRTLQSDAQMVEIVKTFREKQIPLDAVIYLGTGFTPRGWNTEQPSFEFNP
ncbi:MAG: hypothetical protein KDA61_06640, partial [Planctomycetales bacterium]|nr:hypothetical protein [Planctomycetales bacterium]